MSAMDDADAPPELVLADSDEHLSPTQDPASASADNALIPLTLLTGFLGAGKTTLLNYIMTADHGYRVAVCMNDFGDTTDIESTAMTFSADPSSSSNSAPQTSFLSLPNGCLCCSIKEPGIAAIEDMVTRAQEEDAQGRGVDWVVVELTGLADPAEIARTFWTNEEMGGQLRLDGVIGVADARNIDRQLGDTSLRQQCERQLAASDLVLLNKTDLVSETEAEEAAQLVASINASAEVLQTQRSVVDIGRLFPLNVFSAAADKPNAGPSLAWASIAVPDAASSRSHTHADALSDVTTLTARVPPLSPTQRQRLERLLEDLHWERRMPCQTAGQHEVDILRSKGLFIIKDGGSFHAEVLQGVRDMFEIRRLFVDADELGRLGDLGGKLVVIGRGLGERQAFQAAVDDALTVHMT